MTNQLFDRVIYMVLITAVCRYLDNSGRLKTVDNPTENVSIIKR